MPRPPLVLYSTNTWLAFQLGQTYYNERHWVYCSPKFDNRSSGAYGRPPQPPSSSPGEIFHSLLDEIQRGDMHSAKIQQNKAGLLKGASAKRSQGVITADTEAEIAAVVGLATLKDFSPLLYIIPFYGGTTRATRVPVPQRASLLSEEYIVDDLGRDEFDVIELQRG